MSLEEPRGLSSLRGRRCWVVGCGLLGSALLAACRARGMQALGIDREVVADIQGEAELPSVLAMARERLEPECIFCCAATHGGDEAAYRSTYLDLPRALHAACPAARLIFCSSSSVYGGHGGALMQEDSPCSATSSKACLLREAEGAVLAMGGRVARLVPLYGGGRCELLRRFVQREPELPGEGERFLNYVHREDAARALLFLLSHSLSGDCPPVVNVCGEFFCKKEVYEALSVLTGLPRVEDVSAGGRRGAANQRVSAALLRSLGWEARVRFLRWAEKHWRDWS